ncbi:pyridoxal kinase-like protein [Geranomyces variabilis]|nr:pyridoxal kinase-like protein [Geranomyces variabilis]KAJ3142333.1 hypothetical protein HDU90_004606 [Geranomyces variabilis]
MTDNRPRRVLSIQSHVVHGYVGNKAATFPLQVLGYEVDPLNAVHFSNHSGYPTVKGARLAPSQLEDLTTGLAVNGILGEYSHLLTGYVGQAQTLAAFPALVKALRDENPGLVYLLDPVMGDNGKLYVPEDVVPVYRDMLLPLADIITPNGFEAGLLSGTQITSFETLATALTALHALGPKLVVITSVTLDSEDVSTVLRLAASHAPSQTRFTIAFRKREGVFTGTGDLFSALLLALLDRGSAAGSISGEDVKRACVQALIRMSQVLDETTSLRIAREARVQSRSGEGGGQGERAALLRSSELAIVQSLKWFVEAGKEEAFSTKFEAVDF